MLPIQESQERPWAELLRPGGAAFQCAWQLVDAEQTERELDGLLGLGVTVGWELYQRVTGLRP